MKKLALEATPEIIPLHPWRLRDHVLDKALFLNQDHMDTYREVADVLLGANPYCLVQSASDGMLAYYTMIFKKLFRQSHSLEVTTLMAPEPDQFLDEVNTVLERISLASALGNGPDRNPRQLMIIKDADRSHVENWDVVLHLLRNFPGLNIGFLWLCGDLDPDDNELFRYLGSKLRRFELARLSVAECHQIIQALEQAPHTQSIVRIVERLLEAESRLAA